MQTRGGGTCLRRGATAAALLVATVACGRGGNACCTTTDPPSAGPLAVTTVAGGFDTIWEVAWGPDSFLWVTERPGIISRVNPGTGTVTRAGTITVNEIGEGGLMGLAFHPDFASEPWVYMAHTYAAPGGPRNRVVRMRWNGSALGAPETLLDNIPGASIHNGARLAVGPDRLLYVTTGDAAVPALAQDVNSLAGKVLRLTLEGAPAPGNALGGFVYTLGHRNAQGLVFAPDGTLYAAEHGPSDNDEVNRIEGGRNYGWPTVRGYCDGDAGSGERPFCTANNVVEPLVAWTPTVAPAGMTYYNAELMPAWRGSLLLTTLRGTSLVRLQLSADGRRIVADERLFNGEFGRLRSVTVGPDGAVYLGTSNRDGRGSPRGEDDRILRLRPR